MSEIGIKQVFHLSVFTYYSYFTLSSAREIITNVFKMEDEKNDYMYMVPQFGTIWAQVVFQLYYGLSCLEDLLAFTSKTFLPSIKQRLSDSVSDLFIYTTLPFNLVTCTNFWVLFSIDPDLLDMYDFLRNEVDDNTNFVIHTLVIPILVAEVFVAQKKYPNNQTLGYKLWKISVVPFYYFTVVFGMKLISPVWPYPFYRDMTPLQWVAYMLVNAIFSYCVYVFGYLGTSFFWGKNEESCNETTSKKEECNLTTRRS